MAKLPVKRLRAKGRKVPLTLECPLTTACSGKIAISGRVKRWLLGGRGGGTRKIRMIKTSKYSIRAGGSKKLKLRLTGPARKALKNTRKLVGKATLATSNGEKARFKAVIRG